MTRNTEYHLKDGVCVAVRDRTSGNWLLVHAALHHRLSGAVRVGKDREVTPSFDPPRIGEALFFGDDGADVVTSGLLAIERPQKATVSSYPV